MLSEAAYNVYGYTIQLALLKALVIYYIQSVHSESKIATSGNSASFHPQHD